MWCPYWWFLLQAAHTSLAVIANFEQVFVQWVPVSFKKGVSEVWYVVLHQTTMMNFFTVIVNSWESLNIDNKNFKLYTITYTIYQGGNWIYWPFLKNASEMPQGQMQKFSDTMALPNFSSTNCIHLFAPYRLVCINIRHSSDRIIMERTLVWKELLFSSNSTCLNLLSNKKSYLQNRGILIILGDS